jgi:IclR family transcriptional regulator, pca regulon regulatory protein
MFCTASGRAYLSGLPTAEVQKLLRRMPLKSFTPQTITDPAEILKQIEAAREAGYAWADQEYYRGDITIAAPVFGDDGAPVAAVNISAPSSRWSLLDLRAKLASVLMETARACSSGTAARMRA